MISLEEIDQVIQSGPLTLNLDSLSHQSVQIGIGSQIWNIYPLGRLQCTCPLVRNGHSRNMYIQRESCCDYHREHFGDQASFGYKGSFLYLQPIALIRHLG